MTFEEIQKIIEGMLSVQREIQEGQLQIKENLKAVTTDIQTITTDIQAMQSHGQDVDRRIDQLIGYSINRERDHLDLQQEILDMRRRLIRIERELEKDSSNHTSDDN